MPLDAILFGGRRATNVPLVVEATDWKHGVFMGSNISSERTAAAEGTVGELRRDPFAMLPFCGYNMADYCGHWLKIGQKLRFDRAPRVFQVNWFRKGADGSFLWPGFGDNARVLEWIIRRVEARVPAVDSPIGRLPRTEDLNLDGIDVPQADLDELFAVDPALWLHESDLTEEFYRTFDGRVRALGRAAALRYRLKAARPLPGSSALAAEASARRPSVPLDGPTTVGRPRARSDQQLVLREVAVQRRRGRRARSASPVRRHARGPSRRCDRCRRRSRGGGRSR